MLSSRTEAVVSEKGAGETESAGGLHEVRAVLALQIRPELGPGGLNQGEVRGIAAPGTDVISRQLSVSMQEFLQGGGAGVSPTSGVRHRQVMQDCLRSAALEAQVVELVEVYFELLRLGRRLEEAGKSAEWCESIRTRWQQGGLSIGGAEIGESLNRTALESGESLLSQQKAWKRAQDRFQRMVGKLPEELKQPAIPSIPSEQASVDLSHNWNYLAAAEAVLSAEACHEQSSRGRLPGIFVAAGNPQSGGSGSGDRPEVTPGSPVPGLEARKVAFQRIKALELQSAADLQREYALSVLWRKRQASLKEASALRTQVAMLAGIAARSEPALQPGSRSLDEILREHQRLCEARQRLIDAESEVQVNAFRILGVQGRCADFIRKGEGYLDKLAAGEAGSGSRPQVRGAGMAGSNSSHGAQAESRRNFELVVEDECRRGVLRALMETPRQPGSLREASHSLAGVPAWIEVVSDRIPSNEGNSVR